MMRNIFKLILFSLVLNLATGIMSVAITDSAGKQVFELTDMGRVPQYDANGANVLTGDYTVTNGTGVGNSSGAFSQQDQTVKPGASADTSGNIVFRLLDLVGLGFINKLLTALDYYLFGFINLLRYMFGQFMVGPLYDLLFGTYWTPGLLKTLIMIGYLLGAFELWTNKTIVD